MSKIMVKDFNAETGEELEREATSEEIAQIETDKAESDKEKGELQAKETARAAVLAKLGLTADEAKFLLA
jgi:hypothetical protein